VVSFPLPVSMHIAPGANPADASTLQYTEITGDVRYADTIAIRAGSQDEMSRVDTTGHQATLDARSGNYSPRNPLGTWYGTLRKGTPIQTRVMLIDDLFARTVASGLGTEPASGQAWTLSTPFSVNGSNGLAALASANTTAVTSLPGVASDEVDVLKCTSLGAVTTGAAWVDATLLRYADLSNYIRVHTEYQPGGLIFVKITQVDAGSSIDILPLSATSLSYSAGTKIRTRVQAIGPVIRVKVWLDSGAEPAAWNYAVSAPNTTTRGNAVGLFVWRVSGNTNAGTLTESIYEFRCDTIRATTPVPEWPTRWDQTGKYATSPIVGAGILRRLGQGATALRSPLYRQITSLTRLIGYWPMEDGADSSVLTNVVTSGKPGAATGMSFGANGPDGSASAISFLNADSTSQVSGTFRPASSTAGWQISWALRLNAVPTGNAAMLTWYTNNGYTWSINLAVGFYNIHVVDKDGTVLLDSNVSFTGFDPPNDWVEFRLKATVSGGTVSAEFAWFKQGRSSPFGTTGTFSGTVGALTRWTAIGNTQLQGGSIAHLFGVTTGSDNLQSYEAMRAFDGYAGETAGARLLRLAGEEGVPLVVMGNTALCAPMGVQGVSTFLDLARECEDAEQGVIVERGLGLGFLTWDFRSNVPVTMALDFASGHVADPPEPTDDDQRLINVIKLTRKGGGEVIATDNASVALSGAYIDEPTVSLASDLQLIDHAGWRLHIGTVDELRWPQITLDLRRNPGLIPTWCAMRIGSRITIANPPSVVAGGPLDLILEGFTETIGMHTWDVVMACSPAAPWDVGVYDDAGTRRDSTSTVLGVARDAVQTSWTFSTANTAETWSTNAGDYPLDANCGGERVTVTAMGAISGTGPYTQTATVTRSVNGIVKAQTVNTPITLWRSVVRGLQ
jgi:hypothetical protein